MSYLAFAQELADIADEISMRYFRRSDLSMRSKKDGSVVTQADEEVERALREAIAARHPEHGILGEEEGDAPGTSGMRWILDPIDGTSNYSWGIPVWATLIALESDGDIICGVVSAPALGERFAAERGAGATRNGESIHVSDCRDLSDARIGFGSVHAFADQGVLDEFHSLIAASRSDRGIGDFYGHMLVAAGSLDACIEPQLKAWDLGPLILIVEEAGGRLTDRAGVPHIYGGSAVTSNGHLHEAVRAIFGA